MLDPGEASAVELALELKDCLLIIDESKGRKIAQKLGVKVTGNLGVTLTGKQKGLIASVMPLIKKINSTNFRLSEDLISKILDIANERG